MMKIASKPRTSHRSSTMATTIQPQSVPLQEDEGGTLRIAGSRVSLDSVLIAFEQGAIPETIIDMYPGLALADVYAVIAFCLRNRDFVDQYMARRSAEAERMRSEIAARPDRDAFKQRLLDRAKAKGLR
jgi:uncharacterized protein (DUF433 family)